MGSMSAEAGVERTIITDGQFVLAEVDEAATRDFILREAGGLVLAREVAEARVMVARGELPSGIRSLLFWTHVNRSAKQRVRDAEYSVDGVGAVESALSKVATDEYSVGTYQSIKGMHTTAFNLDFMISGIIGRGEQEARA